MGFCFQYIGLFFLVSLPVTIFFPSDFSSKFFFLAFFWAFFFYLKVEQIKFFLFEGVPNFDLGFPNFFLEGKQIKKF